MILEVLIKMALVGVGVWMLYRIGQTTLFKEISLFAREKGGQLAHVFDQDKKAHAQRKRIAKYIKKRNRINDEIG